jgi:ABC-type cobalamin/Fe3+-siderophores transport system ATPase subunit/archaellum component FlaC
MTYTDNRGSEWRKWDLHVHTPESGLANCFGNDWDAYVVALLTTAMYNEVVVIGVTDYFTIDGYKKLKTEYLSNDSKLLALFNNNEEFVRRAKMICFLPNIEFRLHTMVNGSRINYHVIFSDSVSISDIEENFLHEIDFVYEEVPYTPEEKRKLRHENIEVLGAKIKREHPAFTGNDFEVGCLVAAVDDKDIREKLEAKKSLFKNNYLVCIPVDEDLSEYNWNGQGHAVRKGYYQQCNAFFATNQGTINFGLGLKHNCKDDFVSEFKSLKPSICGCDAHSCDEITKWLGQNVVERDSTNPDKIDVQKHILWIKANPSFDGLRQILFEPEGRVRIQPSKPEVKSDRMIISRVEFDSDDSLMGKQAIHLNDNLNSIIGGKSSGKSLLLHSMAEAIDPEQVERISQALKFDGYRPAFDYDLRVYWKNGDIDSIRGKDNEHRKITYIPQLYINYLAEKNNKKDLNDLIVNILRQNDGFRSFYTTQKEFISDYSKEIYSSLIVMLENRTKAIDLKRKLAEIGTEEAIGKSIDDFSKRIEELKKEAFLSTEESARHTELSQKIEVLSAQRDGLKIQIDITAKIVAEVETFIRKLCGETLENGAYVKGGIDAIFENYLHISNDILSLKIIITEGGKGIKDQLVDKIKSFNFENQIERIGKEIKTAEDALLPIMNKLKGQTEIAKLQELHKKEVERLEVSKLTKKQFETARKDYRDTQKDISDLLLKRQNSYLDIQQMINNQYSQIHADISLNAVLRFDRNKLSLYQQVNKTKITSEHTFNAIFTGGGNVDFTKLPKLFGHIQGVTSGGTLIIRDGDKQTEFPLNQNITLDDIYKGLIEDFFELDFEVKYRNDELLNMSPGKKGTVLLILFLQISSAEYPILIDQPEDNLDNRTIYDLLCQMIRLKKAERQIIIVSHNANLVVATDSENVIVANQEGQTTSTTKNRYRFEYVNGALEFSLPKDETRSGVLFQQGIKEHVCDILEGENEAFKHRERKYFYSN